MLVSQDVVPSIPGEHLSVAVDPTTSVVEEATNPVELTDPVANITNNTVNGIADGVPGAALLNKLLSFLAKVEAIPRRIKGIPQQVKHCFSCIRHGLRLGKYEGTGTTPTRSRNAILWLGVLNVLKVLTFVLSLAIFALDIDLYRRASYLDAEEVNKSSHYIFTAGTRTVTSDTGPIPRMLMDRILATVSS
jgi:hypothetical protein